MARKFRRWAAGIVAGSVLALGVVGMTPTAAGASDISGCWGWNIEEGCWQWADCYVYGQNYICFVAEPYGWFQYTYTISG